jgi:methanethiol S-methyltransferase
MSRALIIVFGGVAYLVFFATFLYLIGFVGDVPGLERTVDYGPPASASTAIMVNLVLIALFGVQHSVMARPGFKAATRSVVPEPIERSLYLVAASAVLILLFVWWRPISAVIWSVENAVGAIILWALFGLGWLTVLVSTFLISHFELFGLKQVWMHWRGERAKPMPFHTPLLYRLVRHPMYVGFLIAFWATPHMTAGHLLLALGMSAYILIAIRYEERDLVRTFGADYTAYQENVGMLVPKRVRKSQG